MKSERRFPRIPSSNAVLLDRMDAEDRDVFAKTRQIGAGGCSFVSGERQQAGDLVRLLISLRCAVVEASGRVVYSTEQHDGRFETGVEFLGISSDDRSRITQLTGAIGGASSSH